MSNDPAWNDECHVLKKKISFNKDTPNMRIKFTAENSPSIKSLVRLSAEHVGTAETERLSDGMLWRGVGTEMYSHALRCNIHSLKLS